MSRCAQESKGIKPQFFGVRWLSLLLSQVCQVSEHQQRKHDGGRGVEEGGRSCTRKERGNKDRLGRGSDAVESGLSICQERGCWRMAARPVLTRTLMRGRLSSQMGWAVGRFYECEGMISLSHEIGRRYSLK